MRRVNAAAVAGEFAAVTDWLNQNISRFGSIPAEVGPTPSAVMLESGDLAPYDQVRLQARLTCLTGWRKGALAKRRLG